MFIKGFYTNPMDTSLPIILTKENKFLLNICGINCNYKEYTREELLKDLNKHKRCFEKEKVNFEQIYNEFLVAMDKCENMSWLNEEIARKICYNTFSKRKWGSWWLLRALMQYTDEYDDIIKQICPNTKYNSLYYNDFFEELRNE